MESITTLWTLEDICPINFWYGELIFEHRRESCTSAEAPHAVYIRGASEVLKSPRRVCRTFVLPQTLAPRLRPGISVQRHSMSKFPRSQASAAGNLQNTATKNQHSVTREPLRVRAFLRKGFRSSAFLPSARFRNLNIASSAGTCARRR